MNRQRFYSTTAAVGAALLAGLIAVFVNLSINGLTAASNWATILGAIAALAALLATLFQRRSARFDERTTEDIVKTMLLRAPLRADQQFSFDLSLRVEPGNGKQSIFPLAVPSEASPVVSSRYLIDSYVSNPGRILIVGAAGTGKSSILSRLSYELSVAAVNGESEYIPVLMQAARFYPGGALPFEEYLQDRVIQMYGVRQPDLIGAVLSGHPILPLIDGLDEVQPEYRYQVFNEIDRWLSKERDRPAVLSSRESVYHDVLRFIQVGSIFFIEPLSLTDAVRYLALLRQFEAAGDEVGAYQIDDALMRLLAEHESLRNPAILALLSSSSNSIPPRCSNWGKRHFY